MKRIMLMVGMVAAMAGGASGAPLNQAQVGANAKWVLHLDVDGLRNTQVGKLVMQRLTSGAENNKLNALAAMLGTDLRRDLTGVTLYGPQDVDDEGVVILSGKFNQQQLETFVKADDAYVAENYKGATVHSWIDKKKNKRMFGSILSGGASVMMSGSSDALKAGLDAINGQGQSLSTQNGNKLSLAAANGAVLVAAADMSKIKNNKPDAQTLRQAKNASASISEQGADMVGNIVLVADSAENAQHMSDALRGIIALSQLDEKTDAKTKDALRATSIDLQGTTLKVTIRMPAQVLADAMQKKMLEDDAKKAAGTAESK